MNEVGNGVELWVVLAAAFGSALLGAVVGFGGSLYLTVRANKARRNGVVRALLAELVQNSLTAVVVVGGKEKLRKYSTSVWDEAKFEIAQFASRPLFAGLMGVYGGAEVAHKASELIESGDDSYGKVVQGWYDSIRAAYNTLLDEPGLGTITNGWSRMESFEAALVELQQFLKESAEDEETEVSSHDATR